MDLESFIRSLPKTETHLHIEGALPWELLQTLDEEKYAMPPPWWAHDFRFDSFAHFEKELLGHAFQWYISPERYHEAAKIIFQRHLDQNIRYVETSFASGVIEFLGVDGAAVAEAIKSAAPEGMVVKVFMGIHRNGYNEKTQAVLDACHEWDYLDGIDMHGPETLPMEEWSPRLWRQVKEAGKFTKAHAGEFGGAENVRFAVESLGVSRIEHGVRAIEDESVVDLLREREVALDVCPISNVKLRVYEDYASHPLPHLLRHGVVCTLNTDDPLCFGNSLVDEYRVVAEQMGLDRTGLALLAYHGFKVALMDREEKAPYLKELETLIHG